MLLLSAAVNLHGELGESSAVGPVVLDKCFGMALGVSLFREYHASMSKSVKSSGALGVLLGIVGGVGLYGGSHTSMITSLKSVAVLGVFLGIVAGIFSSRGSSATKSKSLKCSEYIMFVSNVTLSLKTWLRRKNKWNKETFKRN